MKLRVMIGGMIAFAWLSLSSFVNFVVIPKSFRISDRAAELAMLVFNRINTVELIFAIGLCFLLFFSKQIKWQKFIFSLSLVTLAFALYYNLFLTPEITRISEQLTLTRAEVKALDLDYYEIKWRHGYYHQQYIIMDAIKLLVLGLLCVLIPWSICSPNDKYPKSDYRPEESEL